MLGALDGALAAHGLSRGRWALAAALTEALRALPRDAAPV
jgi:hypothetical protein